MRITLLLLVVAACLLQVALGYTCGSNGQAGCSAGGEVLKGFICPTNNEACTPLPASATLLTNNQADLKFQINFNNGIQDISSSPITFDAPSLATVTIANDLNGGQIGFGTFAAASPITGTLSSKFPKDAEARSVCLWMKTNNLANQQVGIQWGSVTEYFAVGIINGKFAAWTQNGNYLRTSDSISSGTWEHYCVSYATNGNVNSYKNGAATHSANSALSGNTAASGTVTIGTDASNLFDIRVYSKVLSAAEVRDVFESLPNTLAGRVLLNCGDGLLQVGELCDDNNNVDSDGCTQCAVDPTFVCVGAPSRCMKAVSITSGATDTTFLSSGASTSTALDAATLDVSAIPNPPPSSLTSRAGEFTYSIKKQGDNTKDLVPFGSYQISFIFAETQFSAAKARVFDVDVNGATPSWSPIDVFAAAGAKNKAISRTFTCAADSAGVITISFKNSAIVSQIRVLPASDSVSTGNLHVKGSDTNMVFNPSTGFDDFTMETFVYTSTFAAVSLIEKGSTHISFSLKLDASGKVVSKIRGVEITSTNSIVAGQWNHIAVVSKSGSPRVRYTYINGMLDSHSNEAGTWVKSSELLYLGKSLPASWYIDNVRLWERALSASEINQNAITLTQPAQYSLIEAWDFTQFNAFGAGGVLYGADTRAMTSGIGGDIFESNAVPVVIIDSGSSSDKYFVGGTVASSANSGVFATVRKGAFTYTVPSLRPRQSYEVRIDFLSYGTASTCSVILQQTQVLSGYPSAADVQGVKRYTVNADVSGVITIEFTGSASVAAVTLTPVRAPLGDVRFVVGGAARASMTLQFEAASATNSPSSTNSNGVITFGDNPLKSTLGVSAPYQGVLYKDSPFTITLDKFVPERLYVVRTHHARLSGDNTAGGDRAVAVTVQGESFGTVTVKKFTAITQEYIVEADSNGVITVVLAGAKPTINAIEVLEAPRLLASSQPIGATATTITINGVNLRFGASQAVTLSQSSGTPACSSIDVFDDKVVCHLTGAGVQAGSLTAEWKFSSAVTTPQQRIGAGVVSGIVVAAPIVTANPGLLPASTARLVISGSGFSAPTVTLTQTGFSPKCEVTASSETHIVCKITGLGSGVVKAVVTSSGASSGAAVQVADVKSSAPQVTGAQSPIAASSSTAIFKGKDFAPSPNHAANVVTLTQAYNARKRAVTPVPPTCTVIAATTTTVTCALSGVVAGPMQVTISVYGGPSNTFTVNVAATPSSTLKCVAPAGMPDAVQTSMCNCWSGYAPSGQYPDNCNDFPTCYREIVESTSTGPSFGSPITSFANDQLTIVQKSPIVGNRRETFIKFVNADGSPASPSCGYPGSLWKKTVDGANCRDVYTAVLPWSGKNLCGFVRDNSSQYTNDIAFKAQMDTTYISSYSINGRSIQRVTTESHLVTVTFAKSSTLDTQLSVDFAETSETDFVNVMVETTSWDPSTRVLTVTVNTEATWPYMLDMNQILNGTFAPLTASPSAVTPALTGTSDSSSCTQDDGSVCEQVMIGTLTVTDPDVCDIAGKYVFPLANILCRDVTMGDVCPGNPTTSLEFDVDFTNFCDEEALDPSADIQPVLTAFSDAGMTEGEEMFEEGEQGYFTFTVVSEYATIDSINFTVIKISSPGFADDNIYPSYPTPNDIMFAKKDVTTMVPPGSPAVAAFTFTFSSAHLQLLHNLRTSNNGESSPLTITAIADIHFHGNDGESRKRSVETNFDAFSKTAHGAVTFVHGSGWKSSNNQYSEKQVEQEYEYQDNTGELWAELKEDTPAQLGDWFSSASSTRALTSSYTSLVLLVASFLIVHMIIL